LSLQKYKVLLLIVTIVLALFTALPALEQVLATPQTNYFTEFWVLGAYHNATYHYNIIAGQNYPLFLDISNQLGNCAYYVIQVKFRNQTQSAPDSFNRTSSNQAPLGNITFFAADKLTVEIPVDFSFNYKINNLNSSVMDMQNVIINGEPFSLNATSITRDPSRGGFFGNLFFELWFFNDTANILQYHQRYVGFWLNMTV
jgi:uncharacterized membrane protein